MGIDREFILRDDMPPVRFKVLMDRSGVDIFSGDGYGEGALYMLYKDLDAIHQASLKFRREIQVEQLHSDDNSGA